MNIAVGLVGLTSALLLAGTASAQGGCQRVVVRRDILSLSQQEWAQIASVLRRMDADGWFEYYAEIHNREFGNIHGNDNFFPWHRRFLRDFEEVGQRYDPNFAVPYWDELRDSRDPAGSAVLSSRYLGGNGFGGCVRDGAQAGWTLGFPNRHCLVRQYDRGGQMQPWYSPEYIYSVMQRYNDMHGLREHIEFSLHGSVHLGMGGDMATYWSANDFAFWLHHANLDRLWSEWQSWGHGPTMDGVNHMGGAMSLSSPLPFYGEPAGTTINLGSGRMCFQYAGGGSGRRRVGTAVSFVSSPAGNDTQAAEARLKSLPDPLRKKWFPRLSGPTAVRGNTGARNSTRNSQAALWPAGKPLPYPAPLTEMWITMHHFDRPTVNSIMDEARQFVDDMNRANYLSPY
ncbi:hypothetical protein H4R18_003471 [Coemansia javaensis]|uniref:Tyrosinase copper-binding domain-containing protein n=1 Tax=Coemansia javaensis TaxID=2761396 RepID=A0A9W8HEI5_9FUNG|nr:hypothetical protein H4R18_003471 [Coemansia javaensis]